MKTNQASYKTRRRNQEEWWEAFWYWATICVCWGSIAALFLMGD
jgi:hypothetical protein